MSASDMHLGKCVCKISAKFVFVKLVFSISVKAFYKSYARNPGSLIESS